MKIEIKGGDICINALSFVEALDESSRDDIRKALILDETLIAAVLNTVVTGETFDGWWFGGDTLDRLRQLLVPAMSDVAREIVRKALVDASVAKANEKRFSDWAWAMYHAWPDGHSRYRPELPPFALPAAVTSEAIEAATCGFELSRREAGCGE